MRIINRLKCRMMRGAFPALRCEEAPLPLYDHTEEQLFRRIVHCCRKGDARAMRALSDYFLRLYQKSGERFYVLASNFWRYRSAMYGNYPSARSLCAWAACHPGETMPVPVIFERPGTALEGKMLCRLGFEEINEALVYDLVPCFGGSAVFVRSYPSDETGIWEHAHYIEALRDSQLNTISDAEFYYEADSGREARMPQHSQLVRMAFSNMWSRHKEKFPGYYG